MTTAARFIVEGRMQGVHCRAWPRARATAPELRGHALNCSEGAVDVVAAGPAAALDAVVTGLREGPPAARVEAVSRKPRHAPVAGGGVIG